jgi:hypothetical protein
MPLENRDSLHKTAKQLCTSYPLMIETAKLDRLLTQANCRITSIVSLRDAGAITARKAKQELKGSGSSRGAHAANRWSKFCL